MSMVAFAIIRKESKGLFIVAQQEIGGVPRKYDIDALNALALGLYFFQSFFEFRF
jgi:hypothetical protein